MRGHEYLRPHGTVATTLLVLRESFFRTFVRPQ